ncbi:Uu.00g142870.m01.CDS01 [Anthostomella pinea]|uniref:Uu.00g142870.m01.CDS01 n=1 Tax=Anthostomella pinea TaxID=933095 RepID=A0AAI8VQN3_9PEZI|nr:Uu.00g142870.m01.CDS01 [Anthostomella pinea]
MTSLNIDILVTAIATMGAKVIELLFISGLPPSDCVPVMVLYGRSEPKNEIKYYANWLLALRLYLHSFLMHKQGKEAAMWAVDLHGHEILTKYLKAGADRDVIVVAFLASRSRDGPSSPSPEQLLYLELVDALKLAGFMDDPENASLFQPRGPWYSPHQAVDFVGRWISPWRRCSTFRDTYRLATSDELKDPLLRVWGVVSRYQSFLGSFKVEVY